MLLDLNVVNLTVRQKTNELKESKKLLTLIERHYTELEPLPITGS